MKSTPIAESQDMDYTTGALRWSEAIEAHYGLQPGTFGGTFEAFLERIDPDDRASVTRDGWTGHEVRRRFHSAERLDLA